MVKEHSRLVRRGSFFTTLLLNRSLKALKPTQVRTPASATAACSSRSRSR